MQTKLRSDRYISCLVAIFLALPFIPIISSPLQNTPVLCEVIHQIYLAVEYQHAVLISNKCKIARLFCLCNFLSFWCYFCVILSGVAPGEARRGYSPPVGACSLAPRRKVKSDFFGDFWHL